LKVVAPGNPDAFFQFDDLEPRLPGRLLRLVFEGLATIDIATARFHARFDLHDFAPVESY
jgi:hypothetical protein